MEQPHEEGQALVPDQAVFMPYFIDSLPQVNEVVIGRVLRFTDYFAVVALLEYNGAPGVIMFSELSNKRLRVSPHKILRVDSEYPFRVIKVDTEKKSFELSRRNIEKEEIQSCYDHLAHSKTVHSILLHLSISLHVRSIAELYEKIVYPLQDNENSEIYKHVSILFKESIINPSIIDSLDITKEEKEFLKKDIIHRLGSKNVKVISTIEVSCFTIDGVDSIIESFRLSKNALSDKADLKINIVSPPKYTISTIIKDLDKDVGIKNVNDAILIISKEIQSRSGSIVVIDPPSIQVGE